MVNINKLLVELSTRTTAEINRILSMPNSDFTKETGCETDRVDKCKIETVQITNKTLNFFLNTITDIANGVANEEEPPVEEVVEKE